MAKPIKFKEFKKTRSRMHRVQYEKECGNEVSSPEVYSYVCFLHIEIHPIHEGENKGEELYVVYAGGRDCFETFSLKEAEKYLYKNMKSELPKRTEVEMVNAKKHPRGLDSWLETLFEITEFIGANQSKYENGKLVYQGLDSIEEIDGQAGKREVAEALATEFETKTKDYDWADMSAETTFYEELDKFLEEKFVPKEIEEPVKKKYVALAEVTTTCYLEIEATSQEEADKIAHETDGGEFITEEGNSGGWKIVDVSLKAGE